MKKFKVSSLQQPEYSNDTKRIKKALAENGYEATLEDCEEAWIRYSEGMAASWLGLPESDDELLDMVLLYMAEKRIGETPIPML